jgi:hypothetical protein
MYSGVIAWILVARNYAFTFPPRPGVPSPLDCAYGAGFSVVNAKNGKATFAEGGSPQN